MTRSTGEPICPRIGRYSLKGLYPGIDALYYGNGRQFEYDLVIQPGTDPGVIALRFDGADKLRVDRQGDLVLQTSTGEFRLQAPLIYQVIDGASKAVPGHYVIAQDREVRFQVAAYDSRKPLVIDPVLAFSTYFGGNGDPFTNSIAVDASGNSYIVGGTNQAGVPTTPGAFQPTLPGTAHAFVTKLNATGTALVYSTYIGGSNGEGASGVAVDQSGSAYVVGSTGSSDFPTTSGAPYRTLRSTWSGDSFMAKLNATGSGLLYSTLMGGVGDVGISIAIDSFGNAYVTGYVNSLDLPTVSFPRSYAGGRDVMVAKLNPTGTAFVYLGCFGGVNDEQGFSIAADGAGNAYLAGMTNSPDFPTTAGVVQPALKPQASSSPPSPFPWDRPATNAFVVKVNPAGTGFVYSTYLSGSTGDDRAAGIAVDAGGNAYVTGFAQSADFPTTPGTFQTGKGTDAYHCCAGFLTKLNASGTGLVYSTYLSYLLPPYELTGSVGVGEGLALDAAGNAYVAGAAPLGAFVAAVKSDGSGLLYATTIPGAAHSKGIAVDLAANAYVTGYVDPGSSLATTPGAYQTTRGSGTYTPFV